MNEEESKYGKAKPTKKHPVRCAGHHGLIRGTIWHPPTRIYETYPLVFAESKENWCHPACFLRHAYENVNYNFHRIQRTVNFWWHYKHQQTNPLVIAPPHRLIDVFCGRGGLTYAEYDAIVQGQQWIVDVETAIIDFGDGFECGWTAAVENPKHG